MKGKVPNNAEQWEVDMPLVKPNPYRHMKDYPIERSRVDDLKDSMRNTGVWPNIVGRNGKGDFVEIAYGHHRWIAAKELGLETMVISILPLTDAQMIQMMANENMTSWSHSVKVVNQTIRSVKEFLEKEIKKSKDFNSFHVGENTNMILFDSASQFENCKKNGVGRTVIHKFLGAPWQKWVIREALKSCKMVDEGWIDEDTLSEASSIGAAAELRGIATELEKKGKKKSTVRKIMREVVVVANEEDIGKRGLQDVKESVSFGADPVKAIKRQVKGENVSGRGRPVKLLPRIDSFVTGNLLGSFDKARANMIKVTSQTKHIESEGTKKQLRGGIDKTLRALVKLYVEVMGVTKLKHLLADVLPKQLK